jgi:RPA family protein
MEKIEKIMDREIAWRIFAHEFNMSTLFVSEGDERAPNYIITPTGVKCNRLFIIGVVTEVENIGKDNNLWRARIADPTGVFTIYAGQYQPEPAIFLSELQVPSYVALVGKARKYEPEDGAVYLSVRPEEMNISDEKQRDRWVLEAAERTLERINIMEDALNSGLSGNELQEFVLKKVTNPAFANGAMHAIKHYENLEKTLLEIKKTLAHAIDTVITDSGSMILLQKPEQIGVQDEPGKNIDEFKTHERSFEKMIVKTTPPELEPKEKLASIIDELDTGKGTSYSEVVEIAQKAGLDAQTVELSLKELMDEGRCYEPKLGVLRKV